MAEKIFAKGIYFERPREGSPDFVKGKISIKVHEAIQFLEEHENVGGYVNLDLKKSAGGKLYLELNQWKPKEQKAVEAEVEKDINVASPGVDYPEDEIDPEDIPF